MAFAKTRVVRTDGITEFLSRIFFFFFYNETEVNGVYVCLFMHVCIVCFSCMCIDVRACVRVHAWRVSGCLGTHVRSLHLTPRF